MAATTILMLQAAAHLPLRELQVSKEWTLGDGNGEPGCPGFVGGRTGKGCCLGEDGNWCSDNYE